MASSSGGVPPGFRFHPTDEELLHYYLKKKISFQKFDMDVIREIDLNKVEPWDLQDRCNIGSTPQNEWYFFSHKDRKYPTGSRTNRATNVGFWKATGRDKCIRNTFEKIGMRKTLVFYRGRAPHGQKTDWIMHEYRLEDNDEQHDPLNPTLTSPEDGWVICRVFKKKNLFKVGGTERSRGSMGSDQLDHGSSQPGSFSHPNHQYLPYHQDQPHQQMQTFVDLGLNHGHLSHHHHHQYPHLEAQNFIPTHKPLGYDFSSLPSEDSPVMVKQLMTNHGECDSGSCENQQLPVAYQACEPGLEVGTCEPSQSLPNATGNEWGMMDRLMTSSHLGTTNDQDGDSTKGGLRYENNANASSSSSMQQMNQIPLRGEMDFWRYGK